MAKSNKPVTKKGAVILTAILAVVMVICLVAAILVPTITTTYYDDALRQFFGETAGKANGEGYEKITDGYDTQYVKSEYNSEEAVQAAAKTYFRTAAAEGYVLLENDEDDGLPIETSASSKTQLDLYSQSSVDFIIGGTGSGTSEASATLKDAFEAANYTVNSTLWNYYSKSGYKRDDGAMWYGFAESWGINEVPLETLESNVGSIKDMASASKAANGDEGSIAVFIMSRTGGEGRDEARWMGDYATTETDKNNSYLQPCQEELDTIKALSDNYDRVILVLNTNNVMETGWISDYNISSVIWVPGGGDQAVYALADIFTGAATPSGHLVDTMAYSAMSSPAMVNFGDIAYTDSNGNQTGYYGLSYDEGIYVGYKYYETRYYDSIMDTGKTEGTTGANSTVGSSVDGSAWSYKTEVAYPFGYGLSYTTFEWSNYSVTWCNADGTEKTTTDTLAADDILRVSVTVTNKGDVAGKDVVEVYASVPYTTFDQNNYIEKSAVTLVGYAKTDTLYPSSEANDTTKPNSQPVTIDVSVSDLASYDDVVNQTYILESGTYYITAATDAHEAVNNVLAASVSLTDDQKAAMTSKTESDSIGDASFVETFVPSMTVDTNGVNATIFNTSSTGTTITNQFGATKDSNGFIANAADGGTNLTARDKYLSRQAWSDTWPQKNANQDSKQSSGFSELNGYTWERQIDSSVLAQLQACGTAEAAGNPTSDDSITKDMAGKLGQSGDLELIDYRGIAYKDADWDALVSQMSKKEVIKILGASGYTTSRAASVNKPRTLDYDGPAGLNEMTTGATLSIAYPAEVNMAATWNIEVPETMGAFIAEDCLQNGVTGWYGPAMDIHRTPFSGRNFEYYSEDAFISGTMGRVTVNAAAKKGVYAYVKHFALNDQEDHRTDNGLATYANEQTIRENYLKVFQRVCENNYVDVTYLAAKDDGTYETATSQMPAMTAVMSSLNRVGSTWAGGNYGLLTGILRNEWGFSGIVLTDYFSGGYMDAAQEIRAGGDGILVNTGNGSDHITLKTNADIYYAKQAMSHFLYTVGNSAAMNGLMHGVKIPANPFPYYYLLVIAIDVVVAAGFVVCAVFIARKWLKLKKQNNA